MPFVPPNDPNFRVLEKDIDDRHKKKKESRRLADLCKNKGNEFMKQSKYKNAIKH